METQSDMLGLTLHDMTSDLELVAMMALTLNFLQGFLLVPDAWLSWLSLAYSALTRARESELVTHDELGRANSKNL